MSIFAKINNNTSPECLLEQKISSFIDSNSAIQSYCLKDIEILEADGTGIIDYCPQVFAEVNLEDSYCFKEIENHFNDFVKEQILDFVKKEIDTNNINLDYDSDVYPFTTLYPNDDIFIIWIDDYTIYVDGAESSKILLSTPPAQLPELQPINTLIGQILLIINDEVYYAIEQNTYSDNVVNDFTSTYFAEMEIDNPLTTADTTSVSFGVWDAPETHIFKINEFYYLLDATGFALKFIKCDENFSLEQEEGDWIPEG